MDNSMRNFSVTYTLNSDQFVAVNKLAEQYRRTPKQQFELMMIDGSKRDIEKKFEFWIELSSREVPDAN